MGTALAKTLSLSPTKFATYDRCPEQYLHRYIERCKEEPHFSRPLIRANATHAVIAEVLAVYQEAGAMPVNLQERIRGHLAREPYTSESERSEDYVLVLDMVRRALSQIDAGAEVLAIERLFTFRYRGDGNCPPFSLAAKIDLLVRHEDGELECIDWKTGTSTWLDDIQRTSARIVVHDAYPGEAIRTTVAFLGVGEDHSEVMARDDLKATWNHMKELAAGIAAEKWPATPNSLCEFCPFFQNGCSEYPTEPPLQLVFWLDVAD